MSTTEPLKEETTVRQAMIEDLQKQRAELQTKIEEIDSLLTVLNLAPFEVVRNAEDAQRGDAQQLKVGQLKNMGIAEAMKSYLLFFRSEHKATIPELVQDLSLGGADLGQDDRRERNIKITCSNNDKVFRYSEKDDTVYLLSRTRAVYIDPFGKNHLPKKKKKKKR